MKILQRDDTEFDVDYYLASEVNELKDKCIGLLKEIIDVLVLCNKTDQEIRLIMGELSAQELRVVRATLNLVKSKLGNVG